MTQESTRYCFVAVKVSPQGFRASRTPRLLSGNTCPKTSPWRANPDRPSI